MDQAITLRGSKLMQIAKRKLMIKPREPAASSSGSTTNESPVKILEQAIQVLDKLIRLCNTSSSKNVGALSVIRTASLKFNHAQCRYLDLQSFHDNLVNLVDEMISLETTACEHCRAAALEVAKVTRNAETFVHNCVSAEEEDGEDSWLTKAVFHAGDDGLSAAQQRQDQQWCVSILEVVLAQLRVPVEDTLKQTRKSSSTTPFHQVPYWMIDRTFEIAEEGLPGETDRGLMQAVRLDRRNLTDKLRKLKHKHDGFFFKGLSVFSSRNRRSRVHELTSYLITKLDVDDEEIESFVERIHNREAWTSDNTRRSADEFLLGSGRFGRVYRTEFVGFPAAMKVTSFHSPESFWNEVSVLASTRHPRLAELIFANVTENEAGECRLWTELLGKSLDSVLEIMQTMNQHLQLNVAVEIMLQVAQGMAFLHRRGVLHRDLNAFNVLLVPRRSKRRKHVGNRMLMLDEFVRVKITDFGLPKTKLSGRSSLESSSFSEAEGGEVYQPRLPLWQAPEVFPQGSSPEVTFTKKSDVYSFAMLCYQLFTCRRPFSDVEGLSESLLYRLVSTQRTRPSLLQHCPAYLAVLIERCWSHEPERRPSFPQLCLALRAFKGLMSRRQSASETLPFSPSDFSHLFSQFGLEFYVEMISMHRRKLHKQGESESLFLMMLEREKRAELWPFPMESFLLWLATSVEQLENVQGFGSAAEIIGDLMANWIGSNHDFEQAVFWYFKACTSKSKASGGSARWKLGMCMESGFGVAKDEKKALGLYKQAAREGCASGHVEIGRCYQSGKGTESSMDKAQAHFAKALEMVEKSGCSSVECVEFLLRLLAKACREEECVWGAERIQEIVSKSRLGRLVVAGQECCNVRELVGMLGDWKIREVGRKRAKMVLERLAVEDDILQKALLA